MRSRSPRIIVNIIVVAASPSPSSSSVHLFYKNELFESRSSRAITNIFFFTASTPPPSSIHLFKGKEGKMDVLVGIKAIDSTQPCHNDSTFIRLPDYQFSSLYRFTILHVALDMNNETFNVIAQSNLPYIVHFKPYRPHGFVLGDASLLLSLMPQNAYNRSATSTTHKTLALDAHF